ncbi:MAG: twin-arginine translocation signal domain-containing protein [Balneola sp.]|nr:MAG: twin-arginine translocation signal domain-containing protein [Balneola sp.]
MGTRRDFLKLTALAGTSTVVSPLLSGSKPQTKPIVISTWDHGVVANKVSWEILSENGSALDAVEQGVRVVESDPRGTTVGIGGSPDRDGFVTLDACIMNHKNECGSVAFLQHIENPISVARKVMEETPHVMLAGEGAYQFALEQGFEKKDLLTEKTKKAWEEWLKTSEYKPVINIENHDTISSLALDEEGNLAGACTTSGLRYKMHGRVGDSPIIGAGLFVDNEVGAACATGLGEAIIRTAGSVIIVEMMRNGMSPNEACKAAAERIIEKHEDHANLQVGFLALNKNGEYGAYSVYKGFTYAVRSNDMDEYATSEFVLD